MIKLTSPLTQVDSEAKFTVGTRTQTKDGNEYIYLPGVASVAARDWVTYNTLTSGSYGSVTRLAADAKGPVAIAQAAINGNSYGWFGVRGLFDGYCGQATTSGHALYSCGTTAAVAGAKVNGDGVMNAFAVSTGVSGGTVKAHIVYPFVTDTVPAS